VFWCQSVLHIENRKVVRHRELVAQWMILCSSAYDMASTYQSLYLSTEYEDLISVYSPWKFKRRGYVESSTALDGQ
jgi:hypothetical protein